MAKTPVIGITCDHDAGLRSSSILPGKGAHFLMDDYISAVEAAGGLPLILPIGEGEETAGELVDIIDGLMVTGSFHDIDPSFFDEEPHPRLVSLNPGKTRFEIRLIKAALDKGKAVLGICAGMQTINVAFGGGLIQDIPSQVKGAHHHSQRGETAQPFHTVNIAKGTLLHKIVGVERMRINSTHHQAADRLAGGVIRTAWAEDGVTEGIELPDRRFCLGVQWHPEQTINVDRESALIFEAFMKHASP